MRAFITSVILASGVLSVSWASAGTPICATDANGDEICLDPPAQRIAVLSPGATELMWAAGGGDQVVAVVSWSDYPEAATQVESVGSHTRIDLERLVELDPDLVIGWVTGNPYEQLEALRDLGFPVFSIEPRTFEQVSSTIEQLAVLAGTEAEGFATAEQVRTNMATLADTYADAEPVTVFYQVWDAPLMTVNDEHLISQAIALCGGVNVFGDLERLVPRISAEAVLGGDPEAILAGGMGEENRAWLDEWAQYPTLTATALGNLYFIPPSLIQRPTPRMYDGTKIFCEKLDQARAKR